MKLKHSLSLLDGTMLVAGSMIGSGIFIVSSDIVRNVGSAGWLMLIWALTGLVTLMAAVSYGELAAMFPKAGGQYVYLRESYGKLVAFLYEWSFFAVIQTGTIAAVGVAFAKFTAYLLPAFGEEHLVFIIAGIAVNRAQLVAIVTIILLTWINTRGVKHGKLLQTSLTIVKILSLLGLIVTGFAAFDATVWTANWESAFQPQQWDIATGSAFPIGGAALFAAVTAAMVGSLFSSDAWNSVTFIAGEMRNPQRNVGMSLLLGTLIVTVIYLLTNLAYLAVLPMDGIAFAAADRVGVAASQQIFGAAGGVIIALMIMVSTFGCNNGLILSGARVYYSMAHDGLFFKRAGRLNGFDVPGWGLWAQCIWAAALCLTGTYGDLLDYVIFVVLLFYILTIVGIFMLRYKRPDIERPYKAFGYPVVPVLYIVAASTICIGLLWYKTGTCGLGLLIVLLGLPVYWITNYSSKKKSQH